MRDEILSAHVSLCWMRAERCFAALNMTKGLSPCKGSLCGTHRAEGISSSLLPHPSSLCRAEGCLRHDRSGSLPIPQLGQRQTSVRLITACETWARLW